MSLMPDQDAHNRPDSSSLVDFQDRKWKVDFIKQKRNSKIIVFLLNNFGGYIKNEKQANYILATFATVCILLSIFFLNYAIRGPSNLPREFRTRSNNIR